MTKITRDSLLHTADQARLVLSDEELIKYAEKINEMLTFTEKMNEVDTDNVAPTTNGNQNSNVLREDHPIKWDKREAALANAPDHENGHFKVPAIMD